MTDRNLCQGCRAHEEGTCIAVDHQLKAEVKCPCVICLVKGMCKEGCDDYQLYWYKWKEHIYIRPKPKEHIYVRPPT